MTAEDLPRCTRVLRRGQWSGMAGDRIVLDSTGRHRRRARLETEGGRAVLLDLPLAALLRQGDALDLGPLGLVQVEAAPEPVADLAMPDAAGLVRLAWHLGNRHIPTQVVDARTLRIRDDRVILEMAAGLGAEVAPKEAPFDPETGAYTHAH